MKLAKRRREGYVIQNIPWEEEEGTTGGMNGGEGCWDFQEKERRVRTS